jgi:hypothetical protein
VTPNPKQTCKPIDNKQPSFPFDFGSFLLAVLAIPLSLQFARFCIYAVNVKPFVGTAVAAALNHLPEGRPAAVAVTGFTGLELGFCVS